MIGLSSGINADGSIGDGDEWTSLSQRSKIESRGNRESILLSWIYDNYGRNAAFGEPLNKSEPRIKWNEIGGLVGDEKTKDLANNLRGEEQNSTDEFYWWKTVTNRFHQE